MKTNINDLKGIKGWLLFLCIALTFIFPLNTINKLVQSYSSSIPYFNTYPNLLFANILDITLCGILIIISMYAGISLWQIKENAVSVTKMFLWFGIIYTFLEPALIILIAGLPEIANNAIIKASIIDAIVNFTSFFIWYLYLLKSKRIANTFR